MARRCGASFLRTSGIPELLARSPPDYVDIASKLAGSPRKLAAVRARVEHQRLHGQLFDTQVLSRGCSVLRLLSLLAWLLVVVCEAALVLRVRRWSAILRVLMLARGRQAWAGEFERMLRMMWEVAGATQGEESRHLVMAGYTGWRSF